MHSRAPPPDGGHVPWTSPRLEEDSGRWTLLVYRPNQLGERRERKSLRREMLALRVRRGIALGMIGDEFFYRSTAAN